MAINLNPEAKALIQDYKTREALPSQAAAVNRLIVLTLGHRAQQPQASAPSAPPMAVPAAPQAVAQPPAPTLGSAFKL